MESEQGIKEKQKAVIIIVNTRPKEWFEKEISYEQVIVLAFGNYTNNENMKYTVDYARGDESKHEGSLIKGQSIKVKKEMIFNVTQTNKS
jgi:hypothetical protein